MRLPIFRRGDFRQPPPLRNNLFYHFEHKIIDINVKKICGSAERPGRHLPFFRPAVRARKPSSLVFRTGGREPCRRPGRHRLFFRPAVRAPKPSSLALRAGGREPFRRPGRILPFFRPAVRAPKPSSLFFRTGGREPSRPAGHK